MLRGTRVAQFVHAIAVGGTAAVVAIAPLGSSAERVVLVFAIVVAAAKGFGWLFNHRLAPKRNVRSLAERLPASYRYRLTLEMVDRLRSAFDQEASDIIDLTAVILGELHFSLEEAKHLLAHRNAVKRAADQVLRKQQ